jgi:hypothetical protein
MKKRRAQKSEGQGHLPAPGTPIDLNKAQLFGPNPQGRSPSEQRMHQHLMDTSAQLRQQRNIFQNAPLLAQHLVDSEEFDSEPGSIDINQAQVFEDFPDDESELDWQGSFGPSPNDSIDLNQGKIFEDFKDDKQQGVWNGSFCDPNGPGKRR